MTQREITNILDNLMERGQPLTRDLFDTLGHKAIIAYFKQVLANTEKYAIKREEDRQGFIHKLAEIEGFCSIHDRLMFDIILGDVEVNL